MLDVSFSGGGKMLNETGMLAFESAIRKIFEERRKQLNMTELALGRLAFPHVADPRRKIQSIRKGQGGGEKRKPQQLRGADIVNLCEALGLSWEKTIKQAKNEADSEQEKERLENAKDEGKN